MNYDWYKIFSKPEFEATGLVARTIVGNLEDRGETTFYVTKGFSVGVTYDGHFLPVGLLSLNPYVQGPYAVFEDVNNDIWFGFEVPE